MSTTLLPPPHFTSIHLIDCGITRGHRFTTGACGRRQKCRGNVNRPHRRRGRRRGREKGGPAKKGRLLVDSNSGQERVIDAESRSWQTKEADPAQNVPE